MLASYLGRDDDEGAWRLVSSVVNLAFLVTAALAALVALLAPWLVAHVIAPGFAPSQQALTAGLMRLTLLSTLIFSVSSVVMSTLHAYQHFLLPALAPILYNLGIIGGAVFLSRPLGVWGLAVGAVVGAALHLLIQVPGLLRYRARWSPVIRAAAIRSSRIRSAASTRVECLYLMNSSKARSTSGGALAHSYRTAPRRAR